MIERQAELRRRYTRRAKMIKLKKKLGTATGEAREKILYKINRLSPFWTEASLTQAKSPPPPKAEKVAKEPKKKPAAAGPKGPPREKKA